MSKELFRWGVHVVIQAEDKKGRFLVCFPCGFSYVDVHQLAQHLETEHVLGLDLLDLVLSTEEWLNEGKSEANKTAARQSDTGSSAQIPGAMRKIH